MLSVYRYRHLWRNLGLILHMPLDNFPHTVYHFTNPAGGKPATGLEH
jgi:hypothetical protein